VLPFCQLAFRASKPLQKPYPKALKTLGDHLRKRRLDLALTQKDVAKRLGADETSVWNWEKNRSSPALRFVPRIIEFLGYVPDDTQPETLGQRIVAFRRLRGLTQKELARRLAVDPSTISGWERGEHQPSRHLTSIVGRVVETDDVKGVHPDHGRPQAEKRGNASGNAAGSGMLPPSFP
jgi:transcriptional regulator with XRE-family HTH domain